MPDFQHGDRVRLTRDAEAIVGLSSGFHYRKPVVAGSMYFVVRAEPFHGGLWCYDGHVEYVLPPDAVELAPPSEQRYDWRGHADHRLP